MASQANQFIDRGTLGPNGSCRGGARGGLQEGDAMPLGGDVVRDLRVAVVALHEPVEDVGDELEVGAPEALHGGRASQWRTRATRSGIRMALF